MKDMEKGQIQLMYNFELDEHFMVKRGCLFGYFLLEDSHGTSFYKKYDDFIKSSTLLNNSIVIDSDF